MSAKPKRTIRRPAKNPANKPPSPAKPTAPTTPLPSLSTADRDRLDMFCHADADLILFAKHQSIQPTQALAWSLQPHIQPWITALSAARRQHRETDLTKSLASALTDIRRVLETSADSTTKIRAVNSLVKLAHAILRGNRPSTPHRSARTYHAAAADIGRVQHQHSRLAALKDQPTDHFPDLHPLLDAASAARAARAARAAPTTDPQVPSLAAPQLGAGPAPPSVGPLGSADHLQKSAKSPP